MSNISVLLVDDHNIVRQGLRALLIAEGDMTIVAEAQTGREAVQLAAKLHPEVVVMDLAMPLLNGWEATRQIVKTVPRPALSFSRPTATTIIFNKRLRPVPPPICSSRPRRQTWSKPFAKSKRETRISARPSPNDCANKLAAL